MLRHCINHEIGVQPESSLSQKTIRCRMRIGPEGQYFNTCLLVLVWSEGIAFIKDDTNNTDPNSQRRMHNK